MFDGEVFFITNFTHEQLNQGFGAVPGLNWTDSNPEMAPRHNRSDSDVSCQQRVLAWAPALITGPCCSGSVQFGVKQVPVEFVLIERKDLKIDAFVFVLFFHLLACWRIFRDILHHLDIWHK